MPMGAETAGAGAEGAAAAGEIGQAPGGAGVDPMSSSGFSGPGPAGGGGGLMGLLGGLLKDPNTLKEISGLGGQLAGLIGAGQKLSPATRAMIGQAIAEAKRQSQPQREENPYVGDAMKFVTPEMARGVLDEYGIPYGRIRA